MNRIKFLLLIFVVTLVINGCTENLSTKEDNQNVNFRTMGYVFVKKTILGVDRASKQANKFSYEYLVNYPDQDGKKTILNTNSSTESILILDEFIRISSKQEADSIQESVVDVSFDGSILQESTKDTYDTEITSHDGQTIAYSILEKATNSDIPTEMIFKELVVEGTATHRYQARDFSHLPALYPIAFSPNNSQLLIRASKVREQEPTDPREYYLIDINNGSKKLITSPLENNSNITTILNDFMNDLLIAGTQSEINGNDIENSLVTYDLSQEKLTMTGIFINNLDGIIKCDSSGIAYFDTNKVLKKYLPNSGTVEILRQDWPSNAGSPIWVADNGKLIVYPVFFEREAIESRGNNEVNDANTKVQVTEYYVYDVDSKDDELILTDTRHLDGDEVGDKHYDFLGFIE